MSASLYVHGESLFHRLTPRAKLALAVGLFAVALVFEHPAFVAGPFLAALAVVLAVGGWRNLRRLRVIILAVFLVGLVVWPAFTPAGGPVVFTTPVFAVTEREALVALGRSTRFAAFIVVGVTFVTVTANEELVAGLRSLGVPYPICFAFGTALRLFPTLLSATGTVRQAQAARGHDLDAGGPIERLRNFVPLLVPVFVTAIRDVQTRAMALEARGFDPQADRTFYNRQSYRPSDWIATAAGLGLVVVSVVTRYVFGLGVV